MRARYGAAIAACALAGACHMQSASGPKRTASRDDLVCFHEPQIGTHIVETRCYTRGELDDRRKADREVMEKAQVNANRPVPRRDQ